MSASMERTILSLLGLWLWCFAHCWASYDFSVPDVDCDFESGLCGWQTSSENSRYSWERQRGKASRYSDTGPSRDHTSGRGWYLLLGTTNYQGRRTAEFSSPLISTIHDACLSFWYMMHGYDVARLRVFTTEGYTERKELFSKFGHQGKRWYHAMIDVTPGHFTLTFEATYEGWSALGDIAIDDISLSYDGACPPKDDELMKDQPRFDCDFEVDLCSWHNFEEKEYVWRREFINDDWTDRNALPPFTNGTSYARLIQSRWLRYAVGSLRGPTISVPKTGACMSFWYKKFLNKDTFTVAKHDHGEGKYNVGGEELFVTKKKYGLAWEQVELTLPEGENYYIVFRAMAFHKSMTGILALDDVKISYDGPCVEDEESKINCDFDTDFCLWYMTSPTYVDDWKRGTGPTPSFHTGPDNDHTKGDGFYVYLDASKVENATLLSPYIDVPLEGSCLSFWYYMHGKDVATLNLNVYEMSVLELGQPLPYPNKTLWSRNGEQGEMWLQQSVSIPNGEDIVVGFQAARSYFPRGDIAIDDVKISFEGLCDKGTATATTTTISPTSTAVTATTLPEVDNEMTTEKPKVPTPRLSVIGKVDPALERTTVELICDEENNGTHCKWYWRQYNGTDQEATVIESETQRKLIFDEIQLSHAGTYWCQCNKTHYVNSDVSNQVLIQVVPDPRPIPEITTKGVIEAEPVEVNSFVQLTCGYSVEGATYHWKTTSPAFLDSELPNNQTLTLHARPEHSGFYSCYVTKDGYSTAFSIRFKLHVTSGRRCTSDDTCHGPAYIFQCADMRCLCSHDAVLQDNSCEMRPKQPKIYTSPGFLEFAYGETFYLICEAQVPVPLTAVYSFRRDGQPLSDENMIQTSNILKVTDAGGENSGNYKCFVTHRNIDSFHSVTISVKIKEFTNLSCGFSKDLCEWSTQTGHGFINFHPLSLLTNQIDGDSSPSPPFITSVPKEKETSRAILKSPTIHRSSLDSCLTFWYRMEGSDAYSLTVWTFTFSKDWHEYQGRRLWTTVGHHGYKWIRKNLTVPAGEEFYVAIEVLGKADIDDIVFTYRGSC